MSRLARVAEAGFERIRKWLGWSRAEVGVLGFECDDDLYMRLIEDR